MNGRFVRLVRFAPIGAPPRPPPREACNPSVKLSPTLECSPDRVSEKGRYPRRSGCRYRANQVTRNLLLAPWKLTRESHERERQFGPMSARDLRDDHVSRPRDLALKLDTLRSDEPLVPSRTVPCVISIIWIDPPILIFHLPKGEAISVTIP
jgi:hypothetical protein